MANPALTNDIVYNGHVYLAGETNYPNELVGGITPAKLHSVAVASSPQKIALGSVSYSREDLVSGSVSEPFRTLLPVFNDTLRPDSAGPGLDWVDEAGNQWYYAGGKLCSKSASSGAYHTARLLRPRATASLDQGFTTIITGRSTGSQGGWLRQQVDGSGYLIRQEGYMVNGQSQNVLGSYLYVYRCDNTGNATEIGAIVTGPNDFSNPNKYEIKATIEGVNPIIRVRVKRVDTGLVVGSFGFCDNDPAAIKTPGVVGLVGWNGGGDYTFENTTVYTLNPTTTSMLLLGDSFFDPANTDVNGIDGLLQTSLLNLAMAAHGQPVNIINQAVGGRAAFESVPGGAYFAGYLAAGQAAGCASAIVQYGMNDGRLQVQRTVSQYIADMTSIASGLLAGGIPTVSLVGPTFVHADNITGGQDAYYDASCAGRNGEYCEALRALDNGSSIRVITSPYLTFAQHPEYTEGPNDGVHPVAAGRNVYAELVALGHSNAMRSRAIGMS